MNGFRFAKQFFAHPTRTGALAPSSAALAQRITRAAGLAQNEVIVEFGPGNGVFTEQILREIPESSTFFAMELNGDFVAATRARCPNATVYHDNATNTAKYLEKLGHDSCDCIICGLPWAVFPESLQTELLETIQSILRPGGRFLTFAYLQGLLLPAGLRFRKKINSAFGRVTTTAPEWRNFPPAFVYRAEKSLDAA